MNPVTVQRVVQTLHLLEANEEFQSWVRDLRDPNSRRIDGSLDSVPIHPILMLYHWTRQRLIPGSAFTPPTDNPSLEQLRTARWKIVETDNFGGDYPDEQFVNVAPTTQAKAQMIADAINAVFCAHENAHRFWRVVPQGYKLQPGFEP